MTSSNTVRNFAKLDRGASNRCKYAFVDSTEHRADRILIGALIPVVFERSSPPADEARFELRTCSFDSKYESWFLNCMCDLAWVLEGDADPNGTSAPPDANAASYARACAHLLEGTAAA